MKATHIALPIIGIAMLAGMVAAAGANQYAAGNASPDGLCHGAFANTNGNFSFVAAQIKNPGYPNPLSQSQNGYGIGLTGPNNAGGCGLNTAPLPFP